MYIVAINKHIGTHKDVDEIFDSPDDKAISLGKKSDIIDKSTIPEELNTPKAAQLMQKLVSAGLLNNNWKPVDLSIAERGYLADEITRRLKIKNKWKIMGALWNENPETLRQGMYSAFNQKKTSVFIEKLKKIFG